MRTAAPGRPADLGWSLIRAFPTGGAGAIIRLARLGPGFGCAGRPEGMLQMSLKTLFARVRKVAKRHLKLGGNDVAVVSAAKSGRTWLSAMISHVYHQRFGIPEGEIIRNNNFHRLDPRAPRIFFTHDNRKDSDRR